MAKKTPELVAEALRLRAEGMSLKSIGKRLGVSSVSILRWTDPVAEEKDRKYKETNREQAKEVARRYVAANREKHKESCRRWQKANPERLSTLSARRRQKMHTYKLTGYWKQQVLAIRRTRKSGEHTDHIYPISLGGLEHPWNLQNVSAEENLFWNAKVKPNTSPLVELVPGGFVPLPDFLI